MSEPTEAVTPDDARAATSPPRPELAERFREAVALHRAGQLDAAAERLYAILRQAPDDLAVLQFLGGIEMLRRRFDEAVTLLAAVVERTPRAADAHNNLGMAYAARGQAERAISQYQAAIAVDPSHAGALNNLGSALSALGRNEEAVVRYRAALAIRPALALARTNLGCALTALGRHQEAIAEHQRALAIEPDNATVHLNLGGSLQAAGANDEAAAHFARARALQPQLATAHVRWGRTLQEMGRIEEARACFEKAVALEPERPSHYFNLAANTRLAEGDPRIAAMEALAEAEESVAEPERPTIHFALAKALSGTGRHERAFRHLLRGNALKRQQVSYDEDLVLGRLYRIREVFTAELLRAAGTGDPSRRPIFIVGMPRSGSTLVEQILAGHPGVFAAGEVRAFRHAMREAGAEYGAVPYPDSVPGLSPADLRKLAAAYLAQMASLAAGDRAAGQPQRITDKMPSNFRYLGLIHLALPNARIIHTRRDPIDTCLSCFATMFDHQPFTFDLGELGRYWRAYLAVMAHWHEVLPPGVVLDVQYESVVDNFEAEARRIVAHCGLEWDDSCLAFQEARRPVRTASAVQVRQPLYRDSVGRWRPDAATLRPLLEGMGIAADGAGP